jgi:hypothetical protein
MANFTTSGELFDIAEQVLAEKGSAAHPNDILSLTIDISREWAETALDWAIQRQKVIAYQRTLFESGKANP